MYPCSCAWSRTHAGQTVVPSADSTFLYTVEEVGETAVELTAYEVDPILCSSSIAARTPRAPIGEAERCGGRFHLGERTRSGRAWIRSGGARVHGSPASERESTLNSGRSISCVAVNSVVRERALAADVAFRQRAAEHSQDHELARVSSLLPGDCRGFGGRRAPSTARAGRRDQGQELSPPCFGDRGGEKPLQLRPGYAAPTRSR